MNETLSVQLKLLAPNINDITKRVEQICEEDRQSKHGIYERVLKDIEGTHMLMDKFDACVEAIEVYKKDEYYLSKEARILHISPINSKHLAMEVFIAVMQFHQVTPIQVITTKIANRLEYDDVFDGIKTAAELIGVCAYSGLFTIWRTPLRLQSNYILDPETLDFIDKCKYLNPMVCTPNPWTSNTDGGYLSLCDSVLLGSNNHHAKKQCFDAINILQNIEWELDEETLTYSESIIDHLKSGDSAPTNKQLDADSLLVRNSKITYEEMKGKKFHFVYKLDFRGRMYQQGYYINHQGNDYKRASLSFAKKQYITI